MHPTPTGLAESWKTACSCIAASVPPHLSRSVPGIGQRYQRYTQRSPSWRGSLRMCGYRKLTDDADHYVEDFCISHSECNRDEDGYFEDFRVSHSADGSPLDARRQNGHPCNWPGGSLLEANLTLPDTDDFRALEDKVVAQEIHLDAANLPRVTWRPSWCAKEIELAKLRLLIDTDIATPPSEDMVIAELEAKLAPSLPGPRTKRPGTQVHVQPLRGRHDGRPQHELGQVADAAAWPHSRRAPRSVPTAQASLDVLRHGLDWAGQRGDRARRVARTGWPVNEDTAGAPEREDRRPSDFQSDPDGQPNRSRSRRAARKPRAHAVHQPPPEETPLAGPFVG